MPTIAPDPHATVGAGLAASYDERIKPIAYLFEHQWTALIDGHDRDACVDCRRLGELKARPDEYALCAICRCCGLLITETNDPEDAESFCCGGCEPPDQAHPPL